MAIAFLGNLAHVADQAVHLVTGNESNPVEQALAPIAEAGHQVVAVVAHTEQAAQAVQQLVGGLAPGADKAPCLAALFPDLETKHINALLVVANGINRALKNDGKVDYLEAFGILQEGLRAELS